jgi:diaminohydroxyphosphoribosylaminopyrimidine deaminase/5-amino-6-(5-phosphoribosylamino)uracil reductase
MMRAALMLARRSLGRTWPNPAVGCVVVKEGRVIARGRTQDGGRPHGEADAIANATESLKGATAYVTLEPCSHTGKTPPCADALIAAGVAKVVSAMADPYPEVNGRDQRGFPHAGKGRTAALSPQDRRVARRAHRDGARREQMDHERRRARAWPEPARDA